MRVNFSHEWAPPDDSWYHRRAVEGGIDSDVGVYVLNKVLAGWG